MTLDLKKVLARYDAEVRAVPRAQSGTSIEYEGSIVRLQSHFGFISYWRFSAGEAAAAVAAQAALFRSRGQELIWRIHDYDQPKALAGVLAAEGFEPEPPGVLMIFDLKQELHIGETYPVDVQRVRSGEALDAFLAASGKAFGAEETWRRAAYADRLDDPDLALYVAYIEGEPVAAGRLEMASPGAFGRLFGGGVAPDFRGRGTYRTLVGKRVDEARARGLEYLVTEARNSSRPILERLGFLPAATETTWRLRP